ncbi:MAG: ThuA domain-containing protein [Fimbriimonadaceae bacterium]|nr:ThuA domain-containing protein [Fimbriimonadaceae bacterium]
MLGLLLALLDTPSPKHIVLLAGDEEYRSEEALPQLAKILTTRHGFKCTVLYSVNAKGEIDPNTQDNQPGMSSLDSADLCIMMLRFRRWPDEQMKHFVDYYRSGKPIIALRTSTHAFDYPEDSSSAYRRFGWRSKDWSGGFGEQVLGENWISHWGNHGSQGTRAIIEPDVKHPVLKGVEGIYVTTDVYEAHPPADAQILMRGEVVEGMKPTDPPAQGKKKTAKGTEQDFNSPMMPIVWTREVLNDNGKTNRIFTCTMGAATDFLSEPLRRLLVNASYWAMGLPVPAKANVDLVGDYKPSPFGFRKPG